MASTPADVLADYLDVDEVRPALPVANWNVAPTDPVAAVVTRTGSRLLGPMSWGLVPWWATDRKGAARMINARAETLATKPAFRRAFAGRRCLIPADGFYEWQRHGAGPKQPWFIHRADGAPLTFAGIWESWRPPDERAATPGGERPASLRTCSIVTTTANAGLAELHDRMPVLLDHAHWAEWLDPDNDDIAGLARLLVPADDRLLDRYAVTTRVNHVANNGPDLLEPYNCALAPDETPPATESRAGVAPAAGSREQAPAANEQPLTLWAVEGDDSDSAPPT